MILPTRGMLVPATVGVWVFGLAAGLLALGLVVARLRRWRPGPLWAASVVDLAAMAYMFAMMSTGLAWLSVLAATWFTVQAVGWGTGWYGGMLEHGGLGDTAPPTHDADSALASPDRTPDPPPAKAQTQAQAQAQAQVEAPGGAVTLATPTRTARVAAIGQRVIDGGRRDWSVRVTLTVMAVGMAYMLLAMQFGMSPMAGMDGGLSGMSGM